MTLADIWEKHSDYTANNIYGWFRRRVAIPASCQGHDFDLLLGRIDDVDEVWLNGHRIGGTGSFPPNYRWADTVERRYRVPAGLVRGDGSDLIAVRVFDGMNNGGVYAAGKAGDGAGRIGPFAPGESLSAHPLHRTHPRRHRLVSETLSVAGVRPPGVGAFRRRLHEPRAVAQRSSPRRAPHHGYTGFAFDLTPHLNPPGAENVLAVRVRNEGRNSRWYSGSGIYRHVWLTVTAPVHMPIWGVFVTTPEVSKGELMVHAPIPADLTGTLSWWAWPNEAQSWNWSGHEGTPLQVSVYSRCDTVRLTINGRVLGEQPVSEATKLTAKFDVPYAPGELRALGLVKGKVVAETVLRTTGTPKKFRVVADRTAIRADRNDLAYVTVEIVDADGRVVPDAELTVRFAIGGAGELAGQAGAHPKEPASFRAPQRKTYQGRCLAILRPAGAVAAGEITLRAEAGGLDSATLEIRTR